jgi:hypothetical protein
VLARQAGETGLYMIFTWIYNVYHVHMLHQAADVAEDDKVPFHRLHQQ